MEKLSDISIVVEIFNKGIHFRLFLFILAKEALDRALHHMFLWGAVKQISGYMGSTPPSHVFYADDLIIFCNASFANVSIIKQLLDQYGAAFGQVVNRSKSSIVLGRNAKKKYGNNWIWLPEWMLLVCRLPILVCLFLRVDRLKFIYKLILMQLKARWKGGKVPFFILMGAYTADSVCCPW